MKLYYCPKSIKSFSVKDIDYTDPNYNKLFVYCGSCKQYHSILELKTIEQVKERLQKIKNILE